MPSYPSISLSHLPLRPSTLTLLQQHGYLTLAELMESKALGGLATLAAELHVDSAHVMRLLQEIQDCLTASASVTRSSDGSAKGPLEQEAAGGWGASRSTPGTSNHSNENTNPSSTGSRTTHIPQLLVKPPPMLTASDILSKASLEKGGIITFCKSLDVLLHRSGIPLGSLTEIAGLPGLGKTQFGMQLAVNARLPTRLGGVQGQTLYIDAEGSFAPERLQCMAEGLLQHCQNTLRKRGKELPLDFREPSQILQDIHIFRVLDEAAQTATLYSLPYWIEQLSTNQSPTDETTTRTPVKLIVVDSIAFHYRCASGTSQDYQERSRSLTRLAAFLNDVARDYNVAVVCLNQMTTTKKTDGGGGGGPLVAHDSSNGLSSSISTFSNNSSVFF